MYKILRNSCRKSCVASSWTLQSTLYIWHEKAMDRCELTHWLQAWKKAFDEIKPPANMAGIQKAQQDSWSTPFSIIGNSSRSRSDSKKATCAILYYNYICFFYAQVRNF